VASFVLAEPEHYKGIFYVQLLALPIDQRSKIRASSYRDTIIKILKDDLLLNDCLSYTDYLEWHTTQFVQGHLQQVESIH
jgi:hypothetical protein